jgi:hypothetical protein
LPKRMSQIGSELFIVDNSDVESHSEFVGRFNRDDFGASTPAWISPA